MAYVHPTKAVSGFRGVYVHGDSKLAKGHLNQYLIITSMLSLSARLSTLWGGSMLLSLPASAAQEIRNSTDLSCHYLGNDLSSNAPVNSTGSQSFQWSQQEQDWYFTTTVNDTRSPFLVAQMHDIQGYISAPANTKASACVYMFKGINATGGGDDGCEGVMSRECIDWLTRTVSYAPENRGGVSRCAMPPPTEDLRNACGPNVQKLVSAGQSCSWVSGFRPISNALQVSQSIFPITHVPYFLLPKIRCPPTI
jgi:hypothetical protein